jgi:hypothetical protein
MLHGFVSRHLFLSLTPLVGLLPGFFPLDAVALL